MKSPFSSPFPSRWLAKVLPPQALLALVLLLPGLAAAQSQPVTLTVAGPATGPALAPRFLGLSYESSMLIPKDGQYYFEAANQALVNTFKTLGIKSLRVGANAVDDPRIPIPQEKDIDALFGFARAAGVKVIYSFRLKDANPADSALLAGYIAAHDADLLDAFSIGNEPAFFLKTFPEYYAQWRLSYDAILKAVPDAMFDGPSVAGKNLYALELAQAVFPGGHLAMASDHYYFLGSGRAAETNAPASRERFLSNKLHETYGKAYARIGGVLAARGVPYRIDEMNSCYNGGALDSSDTYASTLWALDCLHWWAARHILGVNYHTGESVGRDGKFGPPNYAAFLRQADGQGFVMRPQAYAFLAFTQGAHGQPVSLKIHDAPGFNFNAYAWRDQDGSLWVTLINKSHGPQAQPAAVALPWAPRPGAPAGQRLDLTQSAQDVAAKTGVTLGGTAISPQGTWSGQWTDLPAAGPGNVTVTVAPASATLLHLFAAP